MHGTIDSGYKVERRNLGDLAALADDLRGLAARAMAANVFYEHAFMAAAAPLFGRDVQAGLVWQRGTPARLVGLFPVAVARRRYGIALPVLVGWTHPYAPLGTPLIDRDAGDAAVAAWLDHIAGEPTLPKILLMPLLPAEGAVAKSFDAALHARDGNSRAFAQHRRAMLAPPADRASYLAQSLAPKKRKELRRLRKRLAEAGLLTATVTADPAGVDTALTDFLALEASGWKGRAGTAALGNAPVRHMMQEAVAGLAAEGKASVARLTLDSRPIAATVMLRSGDTAWCWKIAYDEAFARLSPGVQVLLDATAALLADPGIARADSCATPDHPMIDHLWRERLALEDRLIGVAPGRPGVFILACRLERLRRAVIRAARRGRDRLLQRT